MTAGPEGRLDIDKVMQDLRRDNRKFLVQALIAAAAAFGAGIALAWLTWYQQ